MVNNNIRPKGQKYDMAGLWGVSRVTKEWIIDSVRQWRKMDEIAYSINSKKRPREEDLVFPDKKIKLLDTQFMDEKMNKESMSIQKKNFVIIKGEKKDLITYCDTITQKLKGTSTNISVANQLLGEIYFVNKNKCDESQTLQVDNYLKGEVDELGYNLLQRVDDYKLSNVQIDNNIIFIIKQQSEIPKGLPSEKKRIGIVYDPYMCLHDGPYPESPARFGNFL